MSIDCKSEDSVERKLEKAADSVSLHLSSKKWLSIYGLEKLSLDYLHILSKIGFKNSEDYVKILRKPVSSQYSCELFTKIPHKKDGAFYNLTASKEALVKIEKRIQSAVKMYKSRLEWLTSSSRKLFGFIEEKNVCFIIDILEKSDESFQFYIDSIITMIKEQLIYTRTFNFVRASEDIGKWQANCTNTSAYTIICAIDWLLELQSSVEYSNTSFLQTIIDVANDSKLEAVYICTNGGVCTSMKHLLLERVKSLKIPVHVIYFGPCPSDDASFLTELTKTNGGRFLSDGRVRKKSNTTDQHNAIFDCYNGSSISSDVMLIWDELNEAKTILSNIQTIISNVNKEDSSRESSATSKVQMEEEIPKPKNSPSENFISSREWLRRFGLKRLNLTIQSFFKSSTFYHCRGVLDVARKADTTNRKKLVDAKYCDKLGHVRCSDGSIKHVQFSESMYRIYEEKMTEALQKFRRRLDWLQNGSRELFGTIIENKICILIDTSSSMAPRLHVVKDKLLRLFQEQLLMKDSFNILHFGSVVHVWKDTLVSCTPRNLHVAGSWVQRLEAGGSTNTFAAIKAAYSMEGVEALYLLSDGRPDQPSEMILSQVSPLIPIHPISFNCDDDEANGFLCDLAERTGGRYHQFVEELISRTMKQSPYESEDISLIRKEILKGLEYMKEMTEMRSRYLANQTLHSMGRKDSPQIAGFGKQPVFRTSPKISLFSRKRMSESGYLENRTSMLRKSSTLSNAEASVSSKDVTQITDRNVVKSKKKKRKNVSEIKHWLKYNSLTAQQLTIFDALAPNMVQQKGKYIPLLGKEVLSKVYGDAFPLMLTVSKREYKIVNPQALDLVSYEGNLKQFLKDIENKLDSFVFSHLSDDTKENYLSTENASFSYLSNKAEVDEDLEENSVPWVIKDVKLLEGEMKKGKLFLKQSEELRELVKQRNEEAKVAKHARDSMKNQVSSKNNTEPVITKHPNRRRYHRVLARSDVDGFYYPAIVTRYVNSRFIYVLFDNGEAQQVSVRYVISLGGSTARPTLSVGNYILVKISLPKDEIVTSYMGSCYLPGVVQVTPLRMRSVSKYYTVVLYNGSKVTALRKDMHKISYSRFVFAVRFIQEVVQNSFVTNLESFLAVQNTHKTNSKDSKCSSSDEESVKHEDDFVLDEKSGDSVNNNGSFFMVDRDTAIGYMEGVERGNEVLSMDTVRDEKLSEYDELKKQSLTLEEKAALSGEPGDESHKFEGWKQQFEIEYAEKLRELNEQKNILMQLGADLKQNETKQDHQKDMLEKQMQQLKLAQEQHLVNQIQLANRRQEQMEEDFKDHSQRQNEIFRCQQEQQQKLIKILLEKQQQYEGRQSSLQKKVYVKDEQTITDLPFEDFPDNNINMYGEKIPPAVSPVLSQDPFVASEKNSRDTPICNITEKLSDIHVNQEVLARFKDDGWYYRGTIRKIINDSTFVIEDGVNDMEEVLRQDILVDADDAENVINVGDYVVALHPKYQFAYSPGLVLNIENGGALEIQFYDMQVAVVPRVEAYSISADKFGCDSSYIRQCEDSLIGQSVVCRDNETGIFHLGVVRDHVNGSRNYLIEWPDHSLDIQNYAFIFGSHSKRRVFQENSCILALSNVERHVYLPGRVLSCNGSDLVVEFCNMKRADNINGAQSFWLSPDYYENSVKYWRDKNSPFL